MSVRNQTDRSEKRSRALARQVANWELIVGARYAGMIARDRRRATFAAAILYPSMIVAGGVCVFVGLLARSGWPVLFGIPFVVAVGVSIFVYLTNIRAQAGRQIARDLWDTGAPVFGRAPIRSELDLRNWMKLNRVDSKKLAAAESARTKPQTLVPALPPRPLPVEIAMWLTWLAVVCLSAALAWQLVGSERFAQHDPAQLGQSLFALAFGSFGAIFAGAGICWTAYGAATGSWRARAVLGWTVVILVIGCGAGEFLHAAQPGDWLAVGILIVASACWWLPGSNTYFAIARQRSAARWHRFRSPSTSE